MGKNNGTSRENNGGWQILNPPAPNREFALYQEQQIEFNRIAKTSTSGSIDALVQDRNGTGLVCNARPIQQYNVLKTFIGEDTALKDITYGDLVDAGIKLLVSQLSHNANGHLVGLAKRYGYPIILSAGKISPLEKDLLPYAPTAPADASTKTKGLEIRRPSESGGINLLVSVLYFPLDNGEYHPENVVIEVVGKYQRTIDEKDGKVQFYFLQPHEVGQIREYFKDSGFWYKTEGQTERFFTGKVFVWQPNMLDPPHGKEFGVKIDDKDLVAKFKLSKSLLQRI